MKGSREVKMQRRGRQWWMTGTLTNPTTGQSIRVRQSLRTSDPQVARKLFTTRLEALQASHISKNPTILNTWNDFETYCRVNVGRSTLELYRFAIARNFFAFLSEAEHLNPRITHLSALTPSMFERYKAYRAEAGKSATRINMEMRAIKRMFNCAIELGLATSNPAAGVRALRVEENLPRALTAEQVARVLALAQDRDANPVRGTERSPRVYPLTALLFFTGARIGEALAATWGDVDLDVKHPTLYIRNKPSHKIKTARERAVPLHPVAVRALVSIRPKDPEPEPGDRVFAGWSSVVTASRRVRRVLRRAGFKDARTHDARHTLLTALVASGADLKTVQSISGHSTLQVLQQYLHADARAQRAAIARLDFFEPDGGDAIRIADYPGGKEQPSPGPDPKPETGTR